MTVPQIENELGELDQVVQWLLADVDQYPADRSAHSIVAAKQLASNLRLLIGELETQVAATVEKGATQRFGDVQATVKWVPNRTKWDEESVANELRRHVIFNSDGEERTGSEVWDVLTALQPPKGRIIAGSKIGSERLAAALKLDSPEELDEFCHIGWIKRVTVEQVPDVEAAA